MAALMDNVANSIIQEYFRKGRDGYWTWEELVEEVLPLVLVSATDVHAEVVYLTARSLSFKYASRAVWKQLQVDERLSKDVIQLIRFECSRIVGSPNTDPLVEVGADVSSRANTLKLSKTLSRESLLEA